MLKVEGYEWSRKSSRYCCGSRSLEIGDDKEKAEEQIRTAKIRSDLCIRPCKTRVTTAAP